MKIGLIDIETAPHTAYIWGPKNAYISPSNIADPGYTLCWAAKWLGQKTVTFRSRWTHGDKKMIADAYEFLNEADAVIHYNGKKFDIPTLNADFIAAGYPPPDSYAEIDLLLAVRSRFRRYSNKLDEVAKWLGVGAKLQHKGMELWTECMERRRESCRVMKEYNIQDVHLLEDVYNRLLPWIKNHPNYALYVNNDRPTCAKCGSVNVKKNGFEYTKTQKYQRYRCCECQNPMRGRTTVLNAEERSTVLAQVA